MRDLFNAWFNRLVETGMSPTDTPEERLRKAVLGGFIASSGVALWAAFASIGALMFQGPRGALPWFAGYLILLLVSGLLDPLLSGAAPVIPLWVTVSFFVLNIGAVTGTMYVLLRYFIDQRDRLMLALDQEHHLLQEEQARSERLLLNILPKSLAERLKRDPRAVADGVPEATILFADIVEFTRISAGLFPDTLVAWLNDLFSTFDRLVERHGLEKIKTVGDAYMAAGGVPTPRPDPAEAVVEMALDMQREVTARMASSAPRSSSTISGETPSTPQAAWNPTEWPARSR